jgi:hypothetical protein
MVLEGPVQVWYLHGTKINLDPLPSPHRKKNEGVGKYAIIVRQRSEARATQLGAPGLRRLTVLCGPWGKKILIGH